MNLTENNRCLGCGELAQEVDQDDLVDYCDFCANRNSTKHKEITAKLPPVNYIDDDEYDEEDEEYEEYEEEEDCEEDELNVIESAVAYSLETLPERDRVAIANGKGSNRWLEVIRELTDQLSDILGIGRGRN